MILNSFRVRVETQFVFKIIWKAQIQKNKKLNAGIV